MKKNNRHYLTHGNFLNNCKRRLGCSAIYGLVIILTGCQSTPPASPVPTSNEITIIKPPITKETIASHQEPPKPNITNKKPQNTGTNKDDLIGRIRLGMSIPVENDPAIDAQLNWYLNNPEYLEDISGLTEFHKKFLFDLGIDENKIFIFPNYIKKQNENLEIKKIKERNKVLYAGRISFEKGVFDLIESWKKAELNNLRLVLVGSGPEVVQLKQQIENEKNIIYKGEVTNQEVIDLINESRAVVSGTHLHEGQPTLFCEASSLGIPSIFPKSGGITDFFPDNSIFSFERKNLDDLSLKLKLVEDKNLLSKEGIRNKTFIENKLSDENLVRKFKKILND